ncbi:hypothetical protein [Luteimonas sp. MC1572]|uniref:hypothetical protein n=1 Tax=Luteimonas sp. MC1572 TaxID=2799325 RepID=UPI0018F064DA|nr:hypothetical protein [Luteimonas sp. MC1572]MBJ6980568.1 hypothetical protein [Luteimonas sp. MC1572]QQO04434.1 hypothetical protein JGR64_06825 [Luteimonas sp. MC1572]
MLRGRFRGAVAVSVTHPGTDSRTNTMATERIPPQNRFTAPALAGLLLLMWAAWAMPAWAQTVQKCTGRDGHVTFTSGACPDGQRQAASYDATPEVMTAERAAELERRRRQDDANSRYLESLTPRGGRSTSGYWPSRSDGRRSGCDAAKARREDTLRRVGLKRTHDLLRKLDDQVYEACK